MSPGAEAPSGDEWETDRLELDAYLERVAFEGEPGADGSTLQALHRSHVDAVPFENLDILLGRGVSLGMEDIQAKLVDRERGGYCFEHGLLFAAALERLGFEVERLLCRVGDRQPPLPRTHMALRVRASEGEEWLADVGFGLSLIEPLPWGEEGPHAQGGWSYRIVPIGEGNWRVDESSGGDWEALYTFTEEPQHHVDFLVANHFTSTHPASPFVGRPVVMHKEPDRRLRVWGRQLSVLHPDGTAIERELEGAELLETLADPIGIGLTEEEASGVVEALPGNVGG